jgi:hypothetical protein
MTDRDRIIESARKAFGHVSGITDEECLVRRVMQLERFIDERNSALSALGRLAQENDQLRRGKT